MKHVAMLGVAFLGGITLAPSAPRSITMRQLLTTDSARYVVTWTPPTTSALPICCYHVRLVAATAPLPALGTDYSAAYYWKQLGAQLTDTVLVAYGVAPGPVKIMVRACDTVLACGPFGTATTTTFLVASPSPTPVPAPIPAPAPAPSPPAPVPAPSPSPLPTGVVLFESTWATAVGNSDAAVRDGGRWDARWEWGSVPDLVVVAGGPPGYTNALRIEQGGESRAEGALSKNGLPLSRDYYVRFYMKNDDVSGALDHIVSAVFTPAHDFYYMMKSSSSSGWTITQSLWGCGWIYPVSNFHSDFVFSRGVWYRFEYWVHFVDATHVQVHRRVYDAAGTLILTDADFKQDDYGSSATWNGSSTWTLQSFYNAGNSFCVNPVNMQTFSMGNNGQAGAQDTGLYWYYAGVQIRSDGWPGP